MAKFNDSQILQLIIERVNEIRSLIPESTGSHDLDLYDAGRRSVIDSFAFCIDFYSDYEYDE